MAEFQCDDLPACLDFMYGLGCFKAFYPCVGVEFSPVLKQARGRGDGHFYGYELTGLKTGIGNFDQKPSRRGIESRARPDTFLATAYGFAQDTELDPKAFMFSSLLHFPLFLQAAAWRLKYICAIAGPETKKL